MKKFIAVGILVLGLAQNCANRPLQKHISQDSTLVSNISRNLIVSYDAAVGKKDLMAAVRQMGAEVLYDYHSFNMIAIRVKEGMKTNDAKEILMKVKGVTNVTHDSVQQIQNR